MNEPQETDSSNNVNNLLTTHKTYINEVTQLNDEFRETKNATIIF